MHLTSPEAEAVLRAIELELARAKRRQFPMDVVELARRLARKHPSISATDELEAEIMMQAAKAGIPVFVNHWRL